MTSMPSQTPGPRNPWGRRATEFTAMVLAGIVSILVVDGLVLLWHQLPIR